MRRLPLLASLAAGLALPALAVPPSEQLPFMLSHTGRLLDQNDRPVSNPQLAMTFRIFRLAGAAPNETPVWEGHCDVAVSQGAYAVLLGDGTCGKDLTAAALPFGEARYLEVTIDSAALAPRLLVGTVPHAAWAADAGRLGGLTPDAYWKKSEQVDAQTLGGQSLALLDERYARLQQAGAQQQAGDVVTSGRFVGDGSQLTALDAQQLVGQVPEQSLPADLARTLRDTTFTGKLAAGSLETSGSVVLTGPGVFDGDGSALRNLPAPRLVGLVPAASLPADLARTSGSAAFTGNLSAAKFTGDGSGLTNLDATRLTGTIPATSLPSDVARTSAGAAFAGALSAPKFTGDGSGLTNLDATRLTGQVPAASLPSDLARTSGAATFAGALGATNITASGRFTGDGSGLTNLDATKLTGTVSAANLPNDVARLSQAAAFQGTLSAPNVTATTGRFSGDGSGLTNLDATKLSGGPVTVTNAPTSATQAANKGYVDGLWSQMMNVSSCKQIQQLMPNAPDGGYFIRPDAGQPLSQVYCDMTTDGGGWTLISTVRADQAFTQVIVGDRYCPQLTATNGQPVDCRGRMPLGAVSAQRQVLVRDLGSGDWVEYDGFSGSSASALRYFTLQLGLTMSSGCDGTGDHVCGNTSRDPSLHLLRTSGFAYNYNPPLYQWWRYGGWWVGAEAQSGNDCGRLHATSYSTSHDLRTRASAGSCTTQRSAGSQAIFWR